MLFVAKSISNLLNNHKFSKDTRFFKPQANPNSQRRLLTIFDMGLQVLPDVEAQSTDMFAHVQNRVVRDGRVVLSPLSSKAKVAIRS